jgi:HSP20 family protein
MDVFPASPSMNSHSEASPLFSQNMKGDLYEKDDSYLLRLEVPGTSKDDIRIHLTDMNLLKVIVDFKDHERPMASDPKRKHDEKPEEDRAIWSDRFYGKVTFQQRLPDYVDLDKIEVTHKNGILYFRLPKKARSTPKSIKIH